jgi:3'-phosphoadenosine 5'-phosphosulfate sulfotransferase (PAPS reductase)/FAD synthetase
VSAILVPDLVTAALAADAVVAIGVSGGKDSCAVAFATLEHLDAIGHIGPRLLIHSDLGAIEWKDSLPTCERLAVAMGLELVVVRRTAGGMIERWQKRWRDNVRRYRDLSCVKLILPWSTPALRFCTSELKTAVITAYLKKRFKGQTILSVSGIRRDESPKRAKAETVKLQKGLVHAKAGTVGYDWHPILAWSVEDVFECMAAHGFRAHEGYTVYHSSRVSCVACIMASLADLLASARCPDNHEPFRAVIRLEIESAFHFQHGLWLGDVAPELLDDAMRAGLAAAKERGRRRDEIEARIPRHLLYTKGWPHRVPSWDEAALLADVRREVAGLYRWTVRYTTPESVIARHEELLESKARREAAKTAKEAAKASRRAA